MDIEQISADGIPLNIADTQARQDITEIKSNLVNLKLHRATTTLSNGGYTDLGTDFSNNYYFICGYGINNSNALIGGLVYCQQNRYIRLIAINNSVQVGSGQLDIVYYYIDKTNVITH